MKTVGVVVIRIIENLLNLNRGELCVIHATECLMTYKMGLAAIILTSVLSGVQGFRVQGSEVQGSGADGFHNARLNAYGRSLPNGNSYPARPDLVLYRRLSGSEEI